MLCHLQDPRLITRTLQRKFSGGFIITEFFEVDYAVAGHQVLKMSLILV